ncbi:hypothetical protein BKA58DRAFT_96668 [Alternaria rosae]|uniref:uncharacterized protein n=1 Tax=Alternaria rosae TaxID=1187941 RepID=UPI001E8E8285|nr:uncharacterized protein BKA58DRAFT_96668 [Alternaria rosae]KAH6878486.1 hypothetical protein BKA58DRAFT_96668 [Alternaria rosae]
MASDIVFFRTKVNLSPTNSDNEPTEQTSGPAHGASLTSKAKRLLMKADISRVLIPLLFTTLSVVIVSVLFSGASDTYRATENTCSTKPDADISGVGVRASIWGQIAMLILISGSGHLHKKETAIKEVAGGLILTHVSLAIAIIVQMYKRTLTSVDAAIGAVILDVQNVALLIPVTAKQTLAARWQVLILIPAQVLGLVFLPVLVVRFIMGGFASEDCKCLDIFWWSRLSGCETSGNELSLFLIYYTLRWMMWFQSTFHSMYNTQPFHESEKNGRVTILRDDGTKPDTDEEIIALELRDPNRRVTKATVQAGLLYRQYSATISVSHTAYALYSLTSMVVAEVTIGKYNLQPSSNANSIGQIIAIVVSLATLIRVIWSLQSLCNDAENSSFPDFIFSLLSRSPSSCWFGSKADEMGEDPALILSATDVEERRQGSDSDSENEGSGGSQPPRPPQPPQPPHPPQPDTQPSPSNHEAVGRYQKYLEPYPRSPHPSNGRQSSDTISLPKTQPHLPFEQDIRAQHLPLNRIEHQLQRSHSDGPVYQFKFRQPFHLNAVKQLFLPTLTQYLEARKESKATVPISETMISPRITPPTLDQPSACRPPEQPQQDTGKEEAPPPRVVVEGPHAAEVPSSADNKHSVTTSGKPLDSLHGNILPETDSFHWTDQPQKGQATEKLQPQSATRRDIAPASIVTRPEPEEDQPTAARQSEERQPATLSFPIQTPEEELLESSKVDEAAKSSEPEISYRGHDERKGAQSDLPQDNVSAQTEENIPAPMSIFGDGRDFTINPVLSTLNPTNIGLESKMEDPNIGDQSKRGGEPQEPEVQSEKGGASAEIIAKIDAEADIDDPRTTGQSVDSIYHKKLQLEAPKSSLNEVEKTLLERPIRSLASRQWDRVLMDLGIIRRRSSPRRLLMHWVARKWLRVTQEAQRRKKIPYEPNVRSGCPGVWGHCERERTIWEDYPPFRTHFETHVKDLFHVWRKFAICRECLISDTSTNFDPFFMDVEDLSWHVWDKHMHKAERDPSAPPLAEAEKSKGKSAEASKLELSQRLDAEMGGLETATDPNVF